MADRDLLDLKYKVEDRQIETERRVEKVEVSFDAGFIVTIEVQKDNSVDIDMTYPDGETLALESILRSSD